MPEAYNAEVVRWYDHWLKGIDTGVMDEPPIRLFVRGATSGASSTSGRSRGREWTPLYLRRGRPRSDEPGRRRRPDSSSSRRSARDGGDRVLATRPAAPGGHRVIGPLALTLHAAIDGRDTNWIVALRRRARRRASVELTRGFLKASHRALDAERSSRGSRTTRTSRPSPSSPARSSSTGSSSPRSRTCSPRPSDQALDQLHGSLHVASATWSSAPTTSPGTSAATPR